MMIDPALYAAVLERRSTRRFLAEPLVGSECDQVRALMAQAEPLVPAVGCASQLRTQSVDQSLLALLGAYGRLMSPAALLGASLADGALSLTDVGFRLEQVAVGLTAAGLGSCFVGVLSQEQRAARELGLPSGGRMGAALAIGRLPNRPLDRLVNRAIHGAAGAGSRRPLSTLFLGDDWLPTEPPAQLLPLLVAGQRAPSAVNAQPWRWSLREGRLWLLVRRHNRRYGADVRQEYRLFDAGTCLANLTLAGRALGLRLQWQPLPPAPGDIPPELEPVASSPLS